MAPQPPAPITFCVPGHESGGASPTRGRASAPLGAGIGGAIKHSVLVSSQRAASGAAVPVSAVPGKEPHMDDRSLFLKEITEAFGPPGLEDEVAQILRRRTEGFCQSGRDNIGSFIAKKQGTSAEPKVMV